MEAVARNDRARGLLASGTSTSTTPRGEKKRIAVVRKTFKIVSHQRSLGTTET